VETNSLLLTTVLSENYSLPKLKHNRSVDLVHWRNLGIELGSCEPAQLCQYLDRRTFRMEHELFRQVGQIADLGVISREAILRVVPDLKL
jgi:hypothetical protein